MLLKNKNKVKIWKYLSNGSEDASTRPLVHVKEGPRDEAEQAHGHNSGGDAEADIHAGVGLDPDDDGEGDELPN